MQLLDTFSVL